MEGILMLGSAAVAGLIAAVSAFVSQIRWTLAVPGLVLLVTASAWLGFLVSQDSTWLWAAVPWWLGSGSLAVYTLASRRDQRHNMLVTDGVCPFCGHPNANRSPCCPECGR